jgi:4-hydroxy-3-methylbut-2-en-1-yl diphosphate reductase
MPGQIILADAMGFCWGVRRTLRIVEEQANPLNRIATIGDVIHSPQVVDRLRSRGLDTAESVAEANERGYRRVAITAHGASPARAERARGLGIDVVDTTCPLVTKVQRLARKLVEQGYFLVVYGDGRHPEVQGILGWANTTRSVAAMSIGDLPWARADSGSGATGSSIPRKVAVVSQTTKIVDEFLVFSRELLMQVGRDGAELRICNTICAPTTERQNAIARLAKSTDLILVVGGRKSSNTTRLAELARKHGVAAHHIESASEIDDRWLSPEQDVGVTAGASTPDDVIRGVIDALARRGYRRPTASSLLSEAKLDQIPAF